MRGAVRHSCDVVLSSTHDLHVVERHSRPDGHATLRLPRDPGRDTDTGRQKLGHPRQLGTAAAEHEAVAVDRGAPRFRDLGQQAFQAGKDRLQRRADRGLHLAARDAKWGMMQVAIAVELDRGLVSRGDGRTDLELEALGVTWLELGAARLRDGRLDGAVKRLAADWDRLDRNDFAEHDHGRLGRAGAEVDNYDAVGAGDRDLRPDGGGHRLFDQGSPLWPGL